MGSYKSDDEALIGLARQLADAYGEARTRDDQDFACDSIAEFLAEYRMEAPGEALLAILDLPLTSETFPLVDEAQTTLADRGPEVVRLLLEAVLGEVYDPDGPAPERAAETLDMMDRRASVQGLVEVLCGRAEDDVKNAAVDGLVALGPFAEPALAAALSDPRGGEWVEAALRQIRFERSHPGALVEYAAGEGPVPDDPGDLLEPGEEASEDDALAEVAAEVTPQSQAVTPESEAAAPQSEAAAGPDQQSVDDAYDEFLRRYRQETGQDSGPS
jgi:hypothetical protein